MARRNKTNRVRKLLKKEALPSGMGFVSTDEECKKWFNILNKELFNNELPRISFEYKWLRKCWAYYQYFPRAPGRNECIIMHKKYPTHRLFVECLAHEMVHHWQYKKLGWKKVDHGDEFIDWCKKAKSLGLRLGEEQTE